MSDWEADLARQRRNFEESAMEPARAQPDRSEPETDPKLQMGDRGLITAILLAVAAGVAVIALGYLAVDVLVEVSDRAITPAQQFTAAFALATALGALVALVVNVRKQNLAEQLARREITVAFTERFRSAAQQLGGDSPAERLAGVYAMAALADEYPTRRQQCVDVLCGYLRLPFDPATDHLADRSTTTTHVFHDGRTHTVHQNLASRPFDQHVRQTIVTVIHDHVIPGAPVSWSTLNFNLAGAHLVDVNLHGDFSGRLSFRGATFSGRRTSFRGATFSGPRTSFDGVTFSGGPASFAKATFSGPRTSFAGATFSAPHTSFAGATFSGPQASFAGATFSAPQASFAGATFSAPHTSFDGATFSGDEASFRDATFSGGVTFVNATFSGFLVWFDCATFSGGVTFDRATFRGPVIFAHATFPERGKVSFANATFESLVTFDGTVFGADASVLGLEDPRLGHVLQITRDGEAFRGWPPVNGSVEKSGE